MRLSTYDDYFELWLQILQSDEFQPCHALLLNLLHSIRMCEKRPEAILEVQRDACKSILTLESLKKVFDAANDDLMEKFVCHMRIVVKRLLDALVWRVLEYNRIAIHLMAEHNQTGYLDETFFDDLQRADQIVRDEKLIVFVNDLTNVLRHGDLTLIQNGQILMKENKSGKASRKSRRANTQRDILADLHQFLDLNVRTTKESRDYIFTPQVSPKTYHEQVERAIRQAKADGYSQIYLSDSFAVEILYRKHKSFELPSKRPFDGEEYVLPVQSLDISDLPVTKIAPFGVFPFETEDCLDIILGELVIRSILNLSQLQERYHRFGVNFALPQPSKDEIRRYPSASIAERRKQLECLKVEISNDVSTLAVDFSYLWPIMFEFFQEDTLIEGQRQLLCFMTKIPFSDEKATHFYFSFGNEVSIWSR